MSLRHRRSHVLGITIDKSLANIEAILFRQLFHASARYFILHTMLLSHYRFVKTLASGSAVE